MSFRLAPQKLIHAILASLLFGVLSGCTLKPTQEKSVRIDLPSGIGTRTTWLRSSSGGTALVAPTSLSEFQCFGINVVGPGIPDDPRLRCRVPDRRVGRIGGLIPAGGGAIEVFVPAGPGRTVQLFGVRSTVGCTDMNAILDVLDRGGDPGIDAPYLLGSGTVDLFDDAQIALTASFDPTQPNKLFQGCGESGNGTAVPVTHAFAGYFEQPATNEFPVSHSLFSLAPTSTIGAGELFASTPLTAPEIAGLANVRDEYDFGVGYYATSASPGSGNARRAVVQLQFDVTDVDAGVTPYAAVDVQHFGGCYGTCPPEPEFGNERFLTGVAVWDESSATWLPAGWSQPQQARWARSGFRLLPRSLAQLSKLKSDGRRYLIVNVESNAAFSTIYSTGAVSVAKIASAGLYLFPSIPSFSGGGSLGLDSSAPRLIISGIDTLVTEVNQPLGMVAFGGIPPYTFSLGTVSTAPVSVIDPATGRVDTAGSAEVFDVVVTDSVSNTASRRVEVLAANAPARLAVTAPATAVAGACIPVGLTLRSPSGGSGYNHAAMSFSSNIYVDGMNSGSNGALFNDAGCSTNISSVNFAASIGGMTVYFRPTKAAQPVWMEFSYSGGALRGRGGVATTPTTVDRIAVSGPRTVNINQCPAYSLYPADLYGNYAFPYAGAALTTLDGFISPSTPDGTFHVDAASCAAASGNITQIAVPSSSVAPVPAPIVWYRPSSASLHEIRVLGNPTYSYNYVFNNIRVLPAGDAARVTATLGGAVTRTGCTALNIELSQTNGSLGNIPAGYTADVNFNRRGGYEVYNDPGCSSPVSMMSNPHTQLTAPSTGLTLYVRGNMLGSHKFGITAWVHDSSYVDTYNLEPIEQAIVVTP